MIRPLEGKSPKRKRRVDAPTKAPRALAPCSAVQLAVVALTLAVTAFGCGGNDNAVVEPTPATNTANKPVAPDAFELARRDLQSALDDLTKRHPEAVDMDSYLKHWLKGTNGRDAAVALGKKIEAEHEKIAEGSGVPDWVQSMFSLWQLPEDGSELSPADADFLDTYEGATAGFMTQIKALLEFDTISTADFATNDEERTDNPIMSVLSVWHFLSHRTKVLCLLGRDDDALDCAKVSLALADEHSKPHNLVEAMLILAFMESATDATHTVARHAAPDTRKSIIGELTRAERALDCRRMWLGECSFSADSACNLLEMDREELGEYIRKGWPDDRDPADVLAEVAAWIRMLMNLHKLMADERSLLEGGTIGAIRREALRATEGLTKQAREDLLRSAWMPVGASYEYEMECLRRELIRIRLVETTEEGYRSEAGKLIEGYPDYHLEWEPKRVWIKMAEDQFVNDRPFGSPTGRILAYSEIPLAKQPD